MASSSFSTGGKSKRFRFDVDESILLERKLEDSLKPGLDCVIIGINPGLSSAYHGHHYAGVGNHFWPCLYASGIIDWSATFKDDKRLVDHGIGFTNIVERTTRGSSDLSKEEIKNGAIQLRRKLIQYKPKVAVFNGIGIYEIFSGTKNFPLGLQKETLDGTLIFVMPSSSPRSSAYPTLQSKLKFYEKLKKLLNSLRNNQFNQLDQLEFIFPPTEKKNKQTNRMKNSPRDVASYTEQNLKVENQLTLNQLSTCKEGETSGTIKEDKEEEVTVCSRYFLGSSD